MLYQLFFLHYIEIHVTGGECHTNKRNKRRKRKQMDFYRQ